MERNIILLFTIFFYLTLVADCCTQGFPDVETVNTLFSTCSTSGACERETHGNEIANYIIPEMAITCNGTIKKWSVGGDIMQRGRIGDPRLQIWRAMSQQSSTTYTVQAEIPLLTCNGDMLSTGADVHECTLSSGVPVQTGDFLGIVLVQNSRTHFRVYFHSSGTDPPLLTNYFYDDGAQTQFDLSSPGGISVLQFLPLVALEIEPVIQETVAEPDQGATEPAVTTQGTTEPVTIQGITEPVTTRGTTEPVTTQGTTEPVTTWGTTEPVVTAQRTTQLTATTQGTTEPAVTNQGATTGQDNLMDPAGDSSIAIAIAVAATIVSVSTVFMFLLFFVFFSRRRKYSVERPDNEQRDIHIKSLQNPSYSDDQNFSLLRQSSTTHLMEEAQESTMRFEVFENPQYHLGLYVPTGEDRKTLSLKSQPHDYAVVQKRQFGKDYSGRVPEFFSEQTDYWHPASNSNDLYEQLSQKKYREIFRNQIRELNYLGSGQFGEVSKGVWQITPENAMDCAIKTLHTESSEEDKVKFLQEAAINGQFHHPNVVQLLGVVTIGEPVMIILELLNNGDLLKYLRRMRPSPGELVPPDTPHQLLKFCQQVCSGMEYLSRKSFIHRDLAARNILVTDDKICKIADFGMSRSMIDDNYYISHGGKIPVKWTAPEALNYKKHSTASDVWSYGALMYEIWSVGHKPFEKFNNLEVINLVNEGFRLPPPPGCPRIIYGLMIRCWNPMSKQRPSFSKLAELLSAPEFELLALDVDESCDEGALTIGAPLSAADSLYTEMQRTYLPCTAMQ